MATVDTNLIKSYWTQYQLLDCLICFLVLIVSTIVYVAVQPFCRPFSWDDPTINYPYITNVTFPTWSLVLFIVMALMLYGGMVYFLGGPLWPWIKAQLLAVMAQQVITNLLKIYAGRIRPDYLHRLRHLGYNEQSYALSGNLDVSAAQYYCRLGDTHAELREGRLSFPSGHSSLSFAVFTMCALFLFAHLRPSARGGSFVRLLLSVSPLLMAFLCAVSRTRDYWHNFDDVVAGAFIGGVAAVLCFQNGFRVTDGGLCVARWEVLESELRMEEELDALPVTVRVI